MADTNLIMGSMDYATIAEYLGVSVTLVATLFVIVSIWTIIWKGLALWKSARRKSFIWFIVLLLFNTVGILEILYIFVFSKIKLSGKAKTKSIKTKAPKTSSAKPKKKKK